jgi:hypothetical protein
VGPQVERSVLLKDLCDAIRVRLGCHDDYDVRMTRKPLGVVVVGRFQKPGLDSLPDAPPRVIDARRSEVLNESHGVNSDARSTG